MSLTVQRSSGIGLPHTSKLLASVPSRREDNTENKETSCNSSSSPKFKRKASTITGILNSIILLLLIFLTGKSTDAPLSKDEFSIHRTSIASGLVDNPQKPNQVEVLAPLASHDHKATNLISTQTVQQVTPISYKQISSGNVKASILQVDLNDPDIVVKPTLAWDRVGRVETVASMVKRHNAVAGINAGFYDYSGTNLPIGLIMIDGQVVVSNMDDWSRSILIIDNNNHAQIYHPNEHPKLKLTTGDKNAFCVNGVNRPRYPASKIIFTPAYGETTRTTTSGTEIVVAGGVITGIHIGQGNSEIPEDGFVISIHKKADSVVKDFKVGQKVALRADLPEGTKHAILAGPQLIKDGKINITLKEEEFYPRSGTYYSQERAAVGITPHNKLIFIRAHSSKILSFHELARVLLKQGATNAMAFDGGGSSSLIYKGKGTSKRAVSNGILVWEKV